MLAAVATGTLNFEDRQNIIHFDNTGAMTFSA
jgi:hypothetical protein